MLNSIAFIPDGNRRYAKKYGLSLQKAYSKGFNQLRGTLDWSLSSKPKIEEITIWTISTENLTRKSAELEIFLTLLGRKLKDLLKEPYILDNDVRVNIVGRLNLLPKSVQSMAREVMDATKDNSTYKLNFCMGYGGRAEIIDAVKKLMAQGLAPTEENLTKCMYVDAAPDLIIRTGGTKRLSGFMPWQTTYSELYFSDKLWPEFDEADFDEAVREYRRRERRYGR